MFAVHLPSRIALCDVAAREHVVIAGVTATVRADDSGELPLVGGYPQALDLTRSKAAEELEMQEWRGVWCSGH
jgi:hypothetical protein